MSRSRTDSKIPPFKCDLVGHQVRIYRDYRVLLGGSGEEVARAVARTTCSDMNNCPIATHHAGGTSYDWTKCAFVKAEQKA